MLFKKNNKTCYLLLIYESKNNYINISTFTFIIFFYFLSVLKIIEKKNYIRCLFHYYLNKSVKYISSFKKEKKNNNY